MLGIELNGACFLCGAMRVDGFSTATALILVWLLRRSKKIVGSMKLVVVGTDGFDQEAPVLMNTIIKRAKLPHETPSTNRVS